MLRVPMPGGAPVKLRRLVLDANGTLTDRGGQVPGVGERIARLSRPGRDPSAVMK